MEVSLMVKVNECSLTNDNYYVYCDLLFYLVDPIKFSLCYLEARRNATQILWKYNGYNP